jgi:hypothetical protein
MLLLLLLLWLSVPAHSIAQEPCCSSSLTALIPIKMLLFLTFPSLLPKLLRRLRLQQMMVIPRPMMPLLAPISPGATCYITIVKT